MKSSFIFLGKSSRAADQERVLRTLDKVAITEDDTHAEYGDADADDASDEYEDIEPEYTCKAQLIVSAVDNNKQLLSTSATVQLWADEDVDAQRFIAFDGTYCEDFAQAHVNHIVVEDLTLNATTKKASPWYIEWCAERDFGHVATTHAARRINVRLQFNNATTRDQFMLHMNKVCVVKVLIKLLLSCRQSNRHARMASRGAPPRRLRRAVTLCRLRPI